MLHSLRARVYGQDVNAARRLVRRESQTQGARLSKRDNDRLVLAARVGLHLVSILLTHHAQQTFFTVLGQQSVDVRKLLWVVSAVQTLDLAPRGARLLLCRWCGLHVACLIR